MTVYEAANSQTNKESESDEENCERKKRRSRERVSMEGVGVSLDSGDSGPAQNLPESALKCKPSFNLTTQSEIRDGSASSGPCLLSSYESIIFGFEYRHRILFFLQASLLKYYKLIRIFLFKVKTFSSYYPGPSYFPTTLLHSLIPLSQTPGPYYMFIRSCLLYTSDAADE